MYFLISLILHKKLSKLAKIFKITAKIVLKIRQNYNSLLPIFFSAFEINNFSAQYCQFQKIIISMKFLTTFQASPVCQWTWNSWSSCRNNYKTRTVRITRNGRNCPRVRSQSQRCVSVILLDICYIHLF